MSLPGRGIFDVLGSHTGSILTGALVMVAGAWGFIATLDEVRAGSTQRFDEWAVRTLTQWHGPDYRMMEEIGRDLTALGGIAALLICTGAVVGFLWINRNFGAMWLVIIATGGGVVLSGALKYFIHRSRPDIGSQLSNIYTSSFPSGHSMMSVVVYLTLGSLLAHIVHRKRLKLYFVAVALGVSFLVGVSRVYMGVHWPTDVLAGWTAGLAWAILCWLVARVLRRRGQIESENDQ